MTLNTHLCLAWHGRRSFSGDYGGNLVSRRLHLLFPGILLAVGIGGCIVLSGYDGAVVGSIHQGFPSLQWQLPLAKVRDWLIGGVVIALVGFAEAASIARAYATLECQRWNPNQEFISQGVANIAAGLFGGFPVGASFSRSSVNCIVIASILNLMRFAELWRLR